MTTKVLVVDDSLSARQMVRHALGSAGYEVVEAVDGLDGLRKLAANADVSLVLCDVNMPGLDGIRMVDAAHKAGIGAGRTFVMITTEAAPELVKRAKACGAKGWIVKPFNHEALLTAVRRLVGDA